MDDGKLLTAADVAEYILAKCGTISAMKLQKLVYYAQAWALVWTEAPLFEEEIQAWTNGPVVPSLWEQHRGQYQVARGQFKGDPGKVCAEQRDVIDAVIAFYGSRNPQWLSDLTHMEDPWREARRGLPDGASSTHVISKASMLEYYSSLRPECDQEAAAQ